MSIFYFLWIGSIFTPLRRFMQLLGWLQKNAGQHQLKMVLSSILHVCVLSALRHSYSDLSCFLMIRSRTLFDGSKGFVLFSEEYKKSEPFSYWKKVRIFYFLRKAKCRGCAAMKASVGLLSGRTVLRKQDGGALPRQVPARSKRLCVQNFIRRKTV